MFARKNTNRMNFPQSQRNRGGRALSMNRAVASQVQAQLRGERFRPELYPPQFTTNPWCNLTVRLLLTLTAKAPKTVNAKAVGEQILAQFGVSGKVEFRVISASVWGYEPLKEITLWPIDFSLSSTANTTELAVCCGMAQKNMYACAGYRYPASITNNILLGDGTQTICVVGSTVAGDCELHLKVQFHGGDPKITIRDYVNVPIDRCIPRDNAYLVEEETKQIGRLVVQKINDKKTPKIVLPYLKDIRDRLKHLVLTEDYNLTDYKDGSNVSEETDEEFEEIRELKSTNN